METKTKSKTQKVFCPCCETKVKLVNELNTDWYGNLKYYYCEVCRERLVSRNVGDLEIAAPR
jgi:predicted SprT family Zn-dependent metalloprotease